MVRPPTPLLHVHAETAWSKHSSLVLILTYLAKKDFCSCGFFSFFSDSCSRRSMNSAVSGLSEEKPPVNNRPHAGRIVPSSLYSATVESSRGSVDRSHDAERGVEHLQVHFILNLRAPAGSRYGHYGNADEVPRDVRVQSDDVAEVGLDHRTLRSRVHPQSLINLTLKDQEMTLIEFKVKAFQT